MRTLSADKKESNNPGFRQQTCVYAADGSRIGLGWESIVLAHWPRFDVTLQHRVLREGFPNSVS